MIVNGASRPGNCKIGLMIRQYFIVICLAFWLNPQFVGAQAMPAYGLAIGDIRLYNDSTFSANSQHILRSGQRAAVIDATQLEHEDSAQKQLFKWWKVKSQAGKMGWVYGDGFAVVEQKENLPSGLQKYHLSPQKFGAGFEQAELWFAIIGGKDLAAGSNFMGSNYLETYLVLSNATDRSIFVPLSGESQFGKTMVDHLEIAEINGDALPEILIQKTSQGIERSEASQWVDIYAFQAGTLRKIFGESLNGQGRNFEGNMHLTLNKGLIQSAYLKNNPTTYAKQLFTETWYWNPRSKEFEVLYPAQVSLLSAKPKSVRTNLLTEPAGRVANVLLQSDQVFIQEWIRKGQGKIWVKVMTNKGQQGYVNFDELRFTSFQQDAWLRNQLSNQTKEQPLYSLKQ